MNYCGNCGQKLNPDARFCPNCGKGLDKNNLHNTEAGENLPAGQQKAGIQPNTRPLPVSTPPRKKRGKGVYIFIIIFAVLAAAAFFTYKFFLSGPPKMTAELKTPEKNKMITLEKGARAPSNLFGIMLKEQYGKGDADDVAKLVNGNVVGEIELNNVYQIEFGGKTREELMAAIETAGKSDKVELAFPDGDLHVDGAENSSCNPFDDTFYDGEFGNAYKMINLKQAWDIIKASGVKLNDVTVGVLDEKVNYESDEINSGDRIIVPVNRSDMEENNKLTHGTMVTEVIAANEKNGGMTGVASILGENLQINTMAGNDLGGIEVNTGDLDPEDISQIEFPNGKTYTMEAMKNLQKQIDKGATVINCSFSNHLKNYTNGQNAGYSLLFKKFLEKAQKKYPDVIFVGTAGNDMNTQLNDNKIWGKKTDNLITVGAVDKDAGKTAYTNLAVKNGTNEVTVVACGDIKMENGKISSGTSFSAPQVTGLIAILRSINPKLSPAEIKKILTETSKDVSNGQNYQMNLIQADDAVIKAIESATGKKLDKKKLLSMMNVDLKSDGASPEFKITATLESVGDKGAVLEIECTGGDYALGGEKTKTLSSAGSVTWSLSIPKPETIITVKVTRLDTKACKTILVGGKIEAKDLVGVWDGGTCWDSWSTPYKIAEKKIQDAMLTGKGEFLPMSMTVSLISENEIHAEMSVKGSAMPPPPLDFSFNDGDLEAGTTYMMTKYHFSGNVKAEGGNYVITGEWSGSNIGLKMSGRWKATKPIKQN